MWVGTVEEMVAEATVCACAAILLHVLSVDGAFSLSHSLTCWPLWPEKKLLLLQMALLVAVPSSKDSRPSSRLTSQVGPCSLEIDS